MASNSCAGGDETSEDSRAANRKRTSSSSENKNNETSLTIAGEFPTPTKKPKRRNGVERTTSPEALMQKDAADSTSEDILMQLSATGIAAFLSSDSEDEYNIEAISGGSTHKRVESYLAISDIPAAYQKSIKEDKEKQQVWAQPCKPAYGVVAHLYKGDTLVQLLQKIEAKGRNGLIDEYYDIRNSEPHWDFTTSKKAVNANKNRYGDVLCLESTRVILKGEAFENDYINANYVDGFDHKKAYISTQGPLENTIKDQWKLIMQENVRIIVMTTKLAERGKIKCDAYWPLEPLEVCEYGRIKVVNLGIANKGTYQISMLEATNKRTQEVRRVKHFLYLSWPDYGVPPDANGFLKFLFHVRKAQHDFTKEMQYKSHPRGPPIVVHCSAGIGRTGTFIAIDISIFMLEATNKTNIDKIVKRIRQQRAFSVQMPDQYLFCHLALMQYAIKMGKIRAKIDLKAMLLDED